MGDMPPPWSRMRIVTPGEGGCAFVLVVVAVVVVGSSDAVDGSRGMDWRDGFGEEGAIVISIGERSLRFSTVARKAFLRSSVRM